jgi:hypothetical protein
MHAFGAVSAQVSKLRVLLLLTEEQDHLHSCCTAWRVCGDLLWLVPVGSITLLYA